MWRQPATRCYKTIICTARSCYESIFAAKKTPQDEVSWAITRRRYRKASYFRRGCCIGTILFLVLLFNATWILPIALDPNSKSPQKRAREDKWVGSSPYIFDRWLCRAVSLCGIHHLRQDIAGTPLDKESDPLVDYLTLQPRAGNGTHSGRDRRDVPDFVLKHAPFVHLHKAERFFPTDMAKFINHMNVGNHGIIVEDSNTTNITLSNMASLNQYNDSVSLESRDNVEMRPSWLYSHRNIPIPFQPKKDFAAEYDQSAMQILKARAASSFGHKPNEQGYSAAPAVLILVDKGNSTLDAFWFFFYAYNFGQTVLGLRFGNHVADWEHCMVRFQHGNPTGIFLSEHTGGVAYEWKAVEKRKSADGTERPVIFSAIGSHAMYATPGDQPYILPFNLLKDETSRGSLWDPALNNYAFHYDVSRADEDYIAVDDTRTLTPAKSNPQMPTSWFHYRGAWGDDVYPLSDMRQWRLFRQYHYVRGPTGPKWKKLARENLCPKKKCRVLESLKDKASWHQ